MRRGLHRAALAVSLLSCAAGARAQTPATTILDLKTALAGLADRAKQYYERIGTIICIETVTQQELKPNRAPIGKPRVTVYELSVTRDPQPNSDAEFRVERTLQSVNGKPARKNQEPECTDPKTGTPEPLAFLLAKHQGGFTFSFASGSAAGPAGATAIDFRQTPPERVDVKWKGNCFSAEGGGEEGRIWFDPDTLDVLQIEERLPKPFPVPVPPLFGWPSVPVRVEKSEVTMRFTRVKFEQPDETVLLPESTETVTVFRGATSLRTVQVLSHFRRFLAETKVRPVRME